MTQHAKRNPNAAPKIDSKQIEEAVAVGKKTVEQAVAATREQVDHAVAATREQMEKASTATIKGYSDINSFNKDGIDAVVASGSILAKGFEELGKVYFLYGRQAVKTNTDAAKRLMGAKTLSDVVEIQSELARENFDRMVAEGTKLSEIGTKVATDSFAPLQQQITRAADKLGNAATL